MAFRIPEEQHEDVALLYSLSDHEWQTLLEAANEVATTPNLANYVKGVSDRLRDAGIAEAGKIADLLVTFSQLRINYKLTPELFIEELRSASEATGVESIMPSRVDWETVCGFVTPLVSDESRVFQSVKLANINLERPNLFESARVLSDLRPAFGVDTDAGLSQFINLHTLRIQYRKYQGVSEEFFSLDSGDLKALKDEIERALQKEEKMKEFLESKGFLSRDAS
ncbi:hypothetical protein [Thioalkalivibrio sp. ALJ24]|uniref:hypothetical protein n=1 Tax=Thioalkalivibrio sp. ALJ24 TaxID=545276 RepID=UPI0012E9F1FD|nr:hypothetical protein [Thioalkalivibrio sp. ALJ24]